MIGGIVNRCNAAATCKYLSDFRPVSAVIADGPDKTRGPEIIVHYEECILNSTVAVLANYDLGYFMSTCHARKICRRYLSDPGTIEPEPASSSIIECPERSISAHRDIIDRGSRIGNFFPGSGSVGEDS